MIYILIDCFSLFVLRLGHQFFRVLRSFDVFVIAIRKTQTYSLANNNISK